MTESVLVSRVLAGEPTAVGRALSQVERGGRTGQALYHELFPHSGHAYLTGVTGSPGTGKSTLVNELGKHYHSMGRKVAILAVDPTSPFSGGAILGDRLRMQDLFGTGVFIRSMATRGHLGGLAAATADAAMVLDAAGFQTILIETVGAGQGEVEIARNVHTTLVVEAPGLGDDIQAIKAGILEVADILVVNKADREGANATAAALEMNLSLNHEQVSWRPPVLKTVALRGEGIDKLAEAIERHRRYLETNGLLTIKERARLETELRQLLSRELLERALARMMPLEWERLVGKMVSRELDVYSAIADILGTRVSPVV